MNRAAKLTRRLRGAEILVMITCLAAFTFAGGGSFLTLWSFTGRPSPDYVHTTMDTVLFVLMLLDFAILFAASIFLLIYKSRILAVGLFVYFYAYSRLVGYLKGIAGITQGFEIFTGMLLQFFLIFAVFGTILYHIHIYQLEVIGVEPKPLIPRFSMKNTAH